MMGESIVLFERTAGGTDDFGNPVCSWTATEVENCLVKPTQGGDSDTQGEGQRLDGVRLTCTVALPKEFTSETAYNSFQGCRVALIERGMDGTDYNHALRVAGVPFRTVPCPTYWDTLLECGVEDG